MGRAVFQVLVGQAMQIVGLRDQVAVQGAQHPQHTHGLFAPGVEAFDLIARERRVGALCQVDEGLSPDGTEQMGVQFHLGNAAEKLAMGVGDDQARLRGGHLAGTDCHVSDERVCACCCRKGGSGAQIQCGLTTVQK
jgi:hypothetical protein